jgi:hypothetical protein
MYASRRCLEEKQAYFSPLETSYCRQASTYFNAWLFLLAARSNQCPHTRLGEFQWVKAPQLASEPSWFTPYSQGHVSEPLRRCSASECQPDCGSWVRDSIVGLHQQPKMSSESYAWIAGLLNMPCICSGADDGRAEWRNMRRHVSDCCSPEVSIAVHCFLWRPTYVINNIVALAVFFRRL